MISTRVRTGMGQQQDILCGAIKLEQVIAFHTPVDDSIVGLCEHGEVISTL